MVMTFPRQAIMAWNDEQVTDHNRSDLSVSTDRISTDKRMANGTFRRYIVADKRTFDVSWTELPEYSQYTVDGNMGGRDMEAFFTSGLPFVLRLHPFPVPTGDPTTNPRYEEYVVIITDFKKDITKRGANFDFWDVDVTMEEV